MARYLPLRYEERVSSACEPTQTGNGIWTKFFVKINSEQQYLWRAVDHEGEVLESCVTKRRDKAAALKFLRKTMKRNGQPEVIVTDKLRSDRAAMKDIRNARKQEISS